MSELLSFVLQHRMFCQARLPSLYSDFRYLKTTNPNGFHANVTAWKSALADACMAGKIVDCSDKLVLCMGEDLIAWLQSPDWGRPLALGVVVFIVRTCTRSTNSYRRGRVYTTGAMLALHSTGDLEGLESM